MDEPEGPDYHTGDGSLRRVTAKTPLGRVMNMQKRVVKYGNPVATKVGEEEDRAGSVWSIASNHSRKTHLRPLVLADFASLKPEKRRQSDGDIRLGQERKRSAMNPNVSSGRPGNVPSELIKTTTKPMNMPLATHHLTTAIPAAAENELIARRLEEMEEGKDPDRMWTKMGNYVTFALRGFGMFSVSLGRGLYGVGLQKSIRRQATGLKHQ